MFFTFNFPIKYIKTNVPNKAMRKEISILEKIVALAKSKIESKIPKRAESSVAAVLGETNLLEETCCIIKPQILMPIPVKTMLKVRGIRLLKKIATAVSLFFNKSLNVTLPTPIKSEQMMRIIKIIHNNKRFSFSSPHLLLFFKLFIITYLEIF